MNDSLDKLDVGSALNGFADKNTRNKIHTMVPGELVEYDPATRRAKIQPTVRNNEDQGITEYPPLEDVKVQFPGGANWGMSWEPRKGDTGALFFAERSIAEWILSGGVVTPKSKRHHHLSDAFFVPGIFPDNTVPHTHSGSGLTIGNSSNSINIVLSGSGVAVKGDLDVDGDINATGDISANGEVAAGAGNPLTKVTLTGHSHATAPTGPISAPTVPQPEIPALP